MAPIDQPMTSGGVANLSALISAPVFFAIRSIVSGAAGAASTDWPLVFLFLFFCWGCVSASVRAICPPLSLSLMLPLSPLAPSSQSFFSRVHVVEHDNLAVERHALQHRHRPDVHRESQAGDQDERRLLRQLGVGRAEAAVRPRDGAFGEW